MDKLKAAVAAFFAAVKIWLASYSASVPAALSQAIPAAKTIGRSWLSSLVAGLASAGPAAGRIVSAIPALPGLPSRAFMLFLAMGILTGATALVGGRLIWSDIKTSIQNEAVLGAAVKAQETARKAVEADTNALLLRLQGLEADRATLRKASSQAAVDLSEAKADLQRLQSEAASKAAVGNAAGKKASKLKCGTPADRLRLMNGEKPARTKKVS